MSEISLPPPPPFPRDFEPLHRGDPASLLERGSNFLPYEREVRDRYRTWDRARRATDFHHRVPMDLLALLGEVPAPLGLSKALGRRRLYLSRPLPGRPLDGPWVVFEDPDFRPREGRPYRLRRPRRQPLEWREKGEPWSVEEVLWTEEVEPATEGDWVPSPVLSARAAEGLLAAFAEEAALPVDLAGSLLLVFVGAPPWHGRPPGLTSFAGCWEEAPPNLLSGFGSLLHPLLPPWEAARFARARGRTRDLRDAARSAPYRLSIEPAGRPGWEHLRERGASLERSVLLYGGVGGDALGDVLFETHLPLLEPVERWTPLLSAQVDPEVAGGLADHLVRAHFFEPEPLEGDALYLSVDAAIGRIRKVVRDGLEHLNLPAAEHDAFLAQSWGLRDNLVQASLAEARMGAQRQASEPQLGAVTDRFVESLKFLGQGSSERTRELLTLGGKIRSRPLLRRMILLHALVAERPDRSSDELWHRAQRKHLWKNRKAFDVFLGSCLRNGVLVEPRPDRFRWGGL